MFMLISWRAYRHHSWGIVRYWPDMRVREAVTGAYRKSLQPHHCGGTCLSSSSLQRAHWGLSSVAFCDIIGHAFRSQGKLRPRRGSQ